jgi:hypothetical protein
MLESIFDSLCRVLYRGNHDLLDEGRWWDDVLS